MYGMEPLIQYWKFIALTLARCTLLIVEAVEKGTCAKYGRCSEKTVKDVYIAVVYIHTQMKQEVGQPWTLT